MAPEKSPAFQFYPKDFLTDERVGLMSYTERGIYITLLSKCWLEGSLPASVDSIAKLLEIPAPRFRKLWQGALSQCFTPAGDGRITQKRLEEERVKQNEFRRRQSDKGKASVASRFNRGSTVVQPRPVQPEANSSSSSSFSSSSSQQPSAVTAAPKGRPMPGFSRLRLFRWMVEELIATLGDYSDVFGLDEWLQSVDEDGSRVFPETWPWIKSEMLTECQRRGYLIAAPERLGKQSTNLLSAVAGLSDHR